MLSKIISMLVGLILVIQGDLTKFGPMTTVGDFVLIMSVFFALEQLGREE